MDTPPVFNRRRSALPGLFFSVFCLLCLVFTLSGCKNEPQPVVVDVSKRATVSTQPGQFNIRTETINLGIGSMITPREGYTYYRRLADYLEKKLGQPVKIIDRGTYQEFNDLLASGGLDLAFVCGGPYVLGHEKFNLQLLVVPETPGGETVYSSYLIVPQGSSATSLNDLRGKKFAFTDPQSHTGSMVPTYMLAERGETPEKFFGEVVYTYAHDKSIQAVASGVVDGAAVDSLIYDYLAVANPELVNKVRIVSRSEPYGIPPVVVRPDLAETVQTRLQDVLLSMHHDPEGQNILAGMMIKRFVLSNDAAYDGIRRIERGVRPRTMEQ